MESFVLWYEPCIVEGAISNSNKIELHINWGKLPRRRTQRFYDSDVELRSSKFRVYHKFTRFIDIGLKIPNPSNIKNIQLFIPFKASAKDVEDLGHLLSNKDLSSALFNKKMKTESNGNFVKITDVEGKSFNAYCLADRFKFREVPVIEKGSVLVIKLPENQANVEQMYIRFRIKGKGINDFCYNESMPFSFFQSLNTKISMVDFRMNDLREINTSIRNGYLGEGRTFEFSKVHFFYIGTTDDENVFFNQESCSSRLLEENKWTEYLKGLKYKYKKKIIAYHWKAENIQDFNLLLKTSYPSWNVKEITIFILLTIIIGLIINICSTFMIENYLKPYLIHKKEVECICNKALSDENSYN